MMTFSKKSAHFLHDRTVSTPGILCLLITVGILIAGLWPFNFNPVNKVKWLKNADGIIFDYPGIVYSQEPLIIHEAYSHNAACSIELLIRPHLGKGYRSILTLYGRDQEQLIIGQLKKEFYIRVTYADANIFGHKRYREIGIDNVLDEGKTHLLSVISSDKITAIYVDGQLVNSFPNFSVIIDKRGLAGNLILGNSADGRHTWNGTFLGLAIYNTAITNKEVVDHYHAWQQHLLSRPWRPEGPHRPIALYLFDERGGERIHNHSSDRSHLQVPTPIQPFHRIVLEVPTRQYFFTRSNLIDISINILGFIPFGFILAAWLRQAKNLSAPSLYNISIILGFCLSMSIELLQAYLPTRDSSLLDVLNNVLGTAVGVFLLNVFASILPKSQR
jgi:VanZ family protein